MAQYGSLGHPQSKVIRACRGVETAPMWSNGQRHSVQWWGVVHKGAHCSRMERNLTHMIQHRRRGDCISAKSSKKRACTARGPVACGSFGVASRGLEVGKP